MKTYATILVTTLLVLWSITSFVSLEPNPLTWTFSERLVFIVASVFGSLFILAFNEAMEDDREKTKLKKY
jgi:hypothetical protein